MKYLLFVTSFLSAATPAWSRDKAADEHDSTAIVLHHPNRDTTITVLATGQSAPLVNSGQSISVIGADEIALVQGPDLTRMLERLPGVSLARSGPLGSSGFSICVIGAVEIALVQGPDLTRMLERLPGVSLARSGPLGSQTSLFVRGANSQQLVVTLDGVRLADVAAPSGGFDLGTLMTGGIGKIELLRGSNSVVWGSDAIGGVLALTSAQIDGLRAGIEYGAHDTLSADAALGTSGDGYAVTVSGGHVSSDGISAFGAGTEPDSFRQWQAGLNGRVDLASGLQLKAVARYADSRIEFDGFPPPLFRFADTPEYQTTRQGSARVGLDYTGRTVGLQLGLAYADTRRDYFDNAASAAPNFATSGRSWRADLAGRAELGEAVTLNFGADTEWTRFSTSFDPRRAARLSSAHVLLGYHAGAVHLSAGLRIDDHDRFGTHWTFGANGSVELTGSLRLRAAYGEGFKAPTLYQLYGFGGNRGLQPETSRAFEAGLEYGDRNGGRHLALTLFRRDSRNLIDYLFPAGYFNTGRSRAEGVEVEAGWALTDRLSARAAYTHLKATDRVTGRDLPRRPRDAVSAGLDWETPLAGLRLGADLRLAGDSFDDRGNFTRLQGYGLLTLRASVPLGERFELYGRIENVTDTDYQTVAGYGTYGRSAYVGVRVKL